MHILEGYGQKESFCIENGTLQVVSSGISGNVYFAMPMTRPGIIPFWVQMLVPPLTNCGPWQSWTPLRML